MQSVAAAFTAEGRARSRQVSGKTLVSWKRDLSTNRMFTIGVSSIGGDDYIAGPAGVQSAWNKYYYFDESAYAMDIDYERALDMPLGGVSKSLADVRLDNTSGRFIPDYMGGRSELFTALDPGKPIIINSGFKVNGVDQTIPQFVGVLNKSPKVSTRHKTVELQAVDFVEHLSNRYVDDTAMFTGLRTDQVIENILSGLGFATAQYELDTGINTIPFALFERGTKFVDIIDEVTAAEMGHFYQDEEGVLRFENRQHWDDSVFATTLFTADVLEAEAPNEDHLINVVEIESKPRSKQPLQLIFQLSSSLEILAGETRELFVNFDDPMIEIQDPVWVANTASDGSGSAVTNITLVIAGEFATAAKYLFKNNTAATAYITQLTINGRPAKVLEEIYYRAQDDSSVTAYDERPVRINNNYIQSQSWARSFASLLLDTFSEPENLIKLTIRARPELQMGDLVSWGGHYWRIFSIKTQLSPSSGFVQELSLLQRPGATYFRIGVSSIGGTDAIAP